MANHHTTRLIVKLYPLEVNPEVENRMDNSSESTSIKPQDVPASGPINLATNTTKAAATKRVKRDAARRAEQRIADWTNVLRRAPEDVTEL